MEDIYSMSEPPAVDVLRTAAAQSSPDWEAVGQGAIWRIAHGAASAQEAIELYYLLACALRATHQGDLATRLFGLVLRRARLFQMWELATTVGTELAVIHHSTGNMHERDRALDELNLVATHCNNSELVRKCRGIYATLAAHPNGRCAA
jgi:hypothetical protein